MRRICGLTLAFVGGFFVACWLFVAPNVPAGLAVGGPGEEEGEPITSADINGDGGVDLSDAVYLLQFLFQGGPQPVPVDCPEPPPLGIDLPTATGQDRCFDCSGNEIECVVTGSYPGQDAYYGSGCDAADRFVDNGDGTITDRCTGLEWATEAADLDDDGTPDTMRWCQALRYCEESTLGGHEDWKLPNARELHTLRMYGPTELALPEGFEGTDDWYWSSSTNLSDILQAWTVTFRDSPAILARTKLVEHSYARAVRRPPVPPAAR